MQLTPEQITFLETKATDIRMSIIDMLTDAGSGHTAGPLGMADIFTALYFHTLHEIMSYCRTVIFVQYSTPHLLIVDISLYQNWEHYENWAVDYKVIQSDLNCRDWKQHQDH